MHLANLALNLVSIETADAGLKWLTGPWRSLPGTVVLYGAAAVHVVLVLRTLYLKRTLKMPAKEAAQIVLGLFIPLLIAEHVIGTRVYGTMTGIDIDYEFVVRALWIESAFDRRKAGFRAPRDLGAWLPRAAFLAALPRLVPGRRPLAADNSGAGSRAGASGFRRCGPDGRGNGAARAAGGAGADRRSTCGQGRLPEARLRRGSGRCCRYAWPQGAAPRQSPPQPGRGPLRERPGHARAERIERARGEPYRRHPALFGLRRQGPLLDLPRQGHRRRRRPAACWTAGAGDAVAHPCRTRSPPRLPVEADPRPHRAAPACGRPGAHAADRRQAGDAWPRAGDRGAVLRHQEFYSARRPPPALRHRLPAQPLFRHRRQGSGTVGRTARQVHRRRRHGAVRPRNLNRRRLPPGACGVRRHPRRSRPA